MVDKMTNRQKKFFDKTVSMFRDAGCPTLETEYKPADFHNTFGYSGFSKQDLDEFLATPINTEETMI